MRDKVILVDCDGVLLDWEYAYTNWLKRHGYTRVRDDVYCMATAFGIEEDESMRLIRMFNESATIRKLPPLRNAIKYVRKLHEEHGYIFRAISSLSTDAYAQHLRTKNLIELFGPTAFETYTYLDTGAAKDDVLAPYKDSGCFWIEDKPSNADLGVELGLDSILMAHNFNSGYTGKARRVLDWRDIYNTIVWS
jgi:hypothetical protein